jgi:hisJ_fam: histidinol phosphate phosphatase HisJ family
MYYDFHLHSNFSEDSTSPMEDMIKEGIKQNLKGMCFTEHTDLDFPGNNLLFWLI